jgi:hypothetical protein
MSVVEERAVERAAGIVARTFGNTVSPVVSALMAAAAIATGDPMIGGWAIPAGALAGVLAEEAVVTARRAWAAEGVQQFAEEVEAETGEPVEETLVGLRADRAARRLMGEAVAAAADAADEWKIRVLARAFVAGARDGSRVDEMRMLITALHGVETVDARVLALVSRTFTTWEELVAGDPAVEPMLGIVLHRLSQAGLVVADRSEDDLSPYWELTEMGGAVAGLRKI